MDEFGTPLPQHVLDAVAETKVAIKSHHHAGRHGFPQR